MLRGPFGRGDEFHNHLHYGENYAYLRETHCLYSRFVLLPRRHITLKKVGSMLIEHLFQCCLSTGSVFRFCGPINSNSVIVNDQCMVVCNYIK